MLAYAQKFSISLAFALLGDWEQMGEDVHQTGLLEGLKLITISLTPR